LARPSGCERVVQGALIDIASLVFVCGAPHGGSVLSTVSLVASAREAGHDAEALLAAQDPYERRPSVSAIAKLHQLANPLGAASWRVYDRFVRDVKRDAAPEHAWRSSNLPGALLRFARRGTGIVVCSLRQLELSRILDHAARLECPTAWIVREQASLRSVERFGEQVNVLLANSRPLVDEVIRVTGRPCGFVPSTIDRVGLALPRSRRSVVLINAIASHGLETALAIASEAPDLRVVLQESWPLDAETRAGLAAQLRHIPNAEYRPRVDRSAVFRDALILIAPHDPEVVGTARPRVALEAQALGVPMIAHDIPGLAAVAADPELLLPVGSSPSDWIAAIRRVVADYDRFSASAARFADREMLTPAETWRVFVAAAGPQLGITV
jgi:glycosyltransferase involved in cell wall biosynthesis